MTFLSVKMSPVRGVNEMLVFVCLDTSDILSLKFSKSLILNSPSKC